MNDFKSRATAGFTYHWELLDPQGQLVDAWTDHNLLPVEGLNYILNTAFRDGTKQPNWYIALYEGNYTPVTGVTAASFPADAAESTTYVSSTRMAFTSAAAAGGSIDNTAARAEFVSTADKTIYGGAILSSPTKSSTTGVIGSIVRFASAKSFTNGSTLRVTAGVVLASI